MRAVIRSAIMPKFSIRLRSLRDWSAPLLEAATRTRGYPAWLMVGIKAVVTIGLLTVAAAWTMERSAKAHLAQLAGEAAKATPSKASRQR
jgi:predicted signal transduction protein with EAL and GGDEF domain